MSTQLKITNETRLDPGEGVVLAIIDGGVSLGWISLQRPQMGYLIRVLVKRYVVVAARELWRTLIPG